MKKQCWCSVFKEIYGVINFCPGCGESLLVEQNSNNTQQLKAEIAKLVERAKQSAGAGDCGAVKYLLEQIGSQLSAV